MARRKNTYAYSRLNPNGRSSYRRRGIRWNRIIPVGGAILFVLILVIAFNFSRMRLIVKGYSFSEQNEILELTSDKINTILEQDKMDHISTWIEKSKKVNYYDEYEKYYSYHQNMKSKDVIATVDEIFDNYVKKMHGYTDDQLWKILKNASIADMKYLSSHHYSYKDMSPYMKVKGFVYQDMDKYVELYNKVKNYNYAVLYTSYPFIDSSNKTDKHYNIKNPSSLTLLVKKGFYFSSSYRPKDLVKPDAKYLPSNKRNNDNPYLRKAAYESFKKMYNDAKKENLTLLLNSCYRGYNEQKGIYEDMQKKYGALYASTNVAIPGSSEHQTGLGMDITSKSVDDGKSLVFGNTQEYKWLKANCYKYGFVIRYQGDKTKMTGITNEPWHIRYVGKEVAKQMTDNNWCLEEYVLYTGNLPEIK